MYSLFGLLHDNFGHHYVTILLAKMLIWAPFPHFISVLTSVYITILLGLNQLAAFAANLLQCRTPQHLRISQQFQTAKTH